MTCYIARYTKKRDRRKQLEQRLAGAVSAGDQKRIERFAREVRDARIRELRAQRSTIPPDGSVSYDKIDGKIQTAEFITVEDIIAEFQANT